MLQTTVVKRIKAQILCSITFPKILPFMRYGAKNYGTAAQATDDNTYDTAKMR